MPNIGCCGFPVAQEKYYKTFSVVEVQLTFYDFVNTETLRRWREQAPQDFEFIIKVSQFITHPSSSPTYRRAKKLKELNLSHLGSFQPTKEVFDCYKTTVEYAEILGSKILIFQSPPSFSPDEKNIKNMERFFHRIERKNLVFGWESRGKWKPEEVKEICTRFDLIDVVDPFVRDSVYGPIFYYRLHGGKGYRKKFSNEELNSLFEKTKGKNGYVMFNNIAMFEDAQRFEKLMEIEKWQPRKHGIMK
ncbi:MAG: DUF72 domain-containing protein [Candidatus Edwardsbacteria bacterium]